MENADVFIMSEETFVSRDSFCQFATLAKTFNPSSIRNQTLDNIIQPYSGLRGGSNI